MADAGTLTMEKPMDNEQAAPAPVQAPPSSQPISTDTPRRKWPRLILLFSIPAIILIVGGYFWLTSGRYVSTDNAYVQQDIVSVSSDVGGRIVAVNARENQTVKAGDILFQIDPIPYRLALEQANAAIASAQVSIISLQSSYQATSTDISTAREAIRFAEQDYKRQSDLMQTGFTTRARFEAAEHALKQARDSLVAAQADATEAKAKLSNGSAVPGVNPAIAAAIAQRDMAALNLARTQVRAPVGGLISQSDRLQVGQMMINGLPAVSIVSNGRSWVEANFKETDLKNMRVGQSAEIRFDAYPNIKVKGHVASIGAGTGSEFSVLPAQNANGNWVKVTQRVPVRIAIDETPSRPMIAGLSADISIDTQSGK